MNRHLSKQLLTHVGKFALTMSSAVCAVFLKVSRSFKSSSTSRASNRSLALGAPSFFSPTKAATETGACFPRASALRRDVCVSLSRARTICFTRSVRSSISVCTSRIFRMISSTICVCVLSCWVTSRNRGAAFLPRPLISPMCFMYSVHCCVNSLPITEMGSAMSNTDASIARHATSRPAPVTGTSSPYPTVINVTMVHQNESGIDLYGDGTREQPSIRVPSSCVNEPEFADASTEPTHTTSTSRAYRSSVGK
mmetsp:Transcript_10760/g.39884  ORF Transcript_10760/g.39884 Transcript_10760/m.39884 type:complete len:253 (-) Transcript_10760:1462-2220(-)